TFSLSNLRAIDSTFKASESVLKSTPNLIIDVRRNGGGGDAACQPILPYLYSGPVVCIGNEMYATANNVERLQQYLNNPDMPEENKKGIREVAEDMKQHLGRFVMHAQDDTLVPDKIEPYPR